MSNQKTKIGRLTWAESEYQRRKESDAHEQVNQIFYKALKLRPNEQGDMVEDHSGNFQDHILSGESSDACSGSTTGASHAAPAQLSLDQTEATCNYLDEQEERWSLRDEGRSYWGGESYGERQV